MSAASTPPARLAGQAAPLSPDTAPAAGCSPAGDLSQDGASAAPAGYVVLITFQDRGGPLVQTKIECRSAEQASKALDEVFCNLEAFRALFAKNVSASPERLAAAEVTASLLAVRELSPEFHRAMEADGPAPRPAGS